VRSWLVDTGPLVAYLDAGDPTHALVADRLGAFTGQLLTTSAVLTEAMHFVAPAPHGPLLLADLVESSGMQVFDFTQPPLLREAALRMEKYADTPMDFADATLMLLAERLKVSNIATLDRRGFSVYRTFDRKALRLVLQEVPPATE
jgi:hypothetical protein